MTFTEIQTEILARCNLTSSDASSRVGRAINRYYKRLTTSLGLVTSRRAEIQQAVTLGNRRLTFTGTEKIMTVYDPSSGQDRILSEVTFDEMRETTPGTGAPTKYAIDRIGANTVTIIMDTEPADALTLYADAIEDVSTLSGSNEPAFPESYHDILVEGVLVDEYLKIEKPTLSAVSKKNYDERLGELRLFIAKSGWLNVVQGARRGGVRGSAGTTAGTGAGTSGTSSWTQTGLITFDRDPSAPFAVTASSAAVTNLDADLLDGEHGSAYHNAANLTGTASAITGTSILALSATNMTTGSLPDARLSSNVPLKDGTNAFTGANSFATNALNLLVGQITFPTSQNASSDANTLDDYEEGSWAPALGGTGGQSGQVYSTQTGRYIKIGRHVAAWGRIVLSTLGTLTTQVTLMGLPFTADSTTARGQVFVQYWANLTNAKVAIAGQVSISATSATMFTLAAAATSYSNLVQADLSATTEFAFLVIYRAVD